MYLSELQKWQLVVFFVIKLSFKWQKKIRIFLFRLRDQEYAKQKEN